MQASKIRSAQYLHSRSLILVVSDLCSTQHGMWVLAVMLAQLGFGGGCLTGLVLRKEGTAWCVIYGA
jgi:hypothetical protein